MQDTLTKVYSRNAFEQKLFTCKSPKLFLVDIKQFKQINVTFGDEGGVISFYASLHRPLKSLLKTMKWSFIVFKMISLPYCWIRHLSSLKWNV